VNDAATFPASLAGITPRGEPIELRVAGAIVAEALRATVALLGPGDHRTLTEDRPPPPPVAPGDRIRLAGGLVATVAALDPSTPRLAEVVFGLDRPGATAGVWAALYRAGRPVQYAHVPEPLALWDVQNVYAGRPWAVEMPSAGRAIRGETLLALARRGVEVARVTHAAGLSSIGDAAIDAVLPLPERFEVEGATWEAVARARRVGGRVVAIGTSAARALEGAARAGRRTGITDHLLGPGTRRAIVDAVLTGVHETGTSHFDLLRAFAPREVLDAALARAEAESLLGHEHGDLWLVWGAPRRRADVGPGAAARGPFSASSPGAPAR